MDKELRKALRDAIQALVPEQPNSRRTSRLDLIDHWLDEQPRPPDPLVATSP